MVTKEQVYEVLQTCYDPEIPVNIVELGLIYDVAVNEGKVAVKMTLTTPGCGMGTMIASQAQKRILNLPEVKEASVDLVWEPPWDPSMMSAEAREKLASLLDQAARGGDVRIKRRDGKVFVIKIIKRADSPLNVKDLKLNLTRQEILESIRQGRREH